MKDAQAKGGESWIYHSLSLIVYLYLGYSSRWLWVFSQFLLSSVCKVLQRMNSPVGLSCLFASDNSLICRYSALDNRRSGARPIVLVLYWLGGYARSAARADGRRAASCFQLDGPGIVVGPKASDRFRPAVLCGYSNFVVFSDINLISLHA